MRPRSLALSLTLKSSVFITALKHDICRCSKGFLTFTFWFAVFLPKGRGGRVFVNTAEFANDRISAVSLVWLSRSVCWRCLLLCAALLWMCSLTLKPKHGTHLTRLWQCKYVPNTYKEAIFCMLFVHLDIIKNNKIMKSEETLYVLGLFLVFFAQ